MPPSRHIDDAERRARLAVRHALSEAHRVDTPEAATVAMTVLHATEAANVHLACWARVRGFALDDMDRALYLDRTVVKQLAMRRTLFAFPRDLLGPTLASASARTATAERTRLAKDLEHAGLTDDGGAWLDDARTAVLDALADAPEGLTAAEVRAAVPSVDVQVDAPSGTPWSTPRLLVYLGAAGAIVRGTNEGSFKVSRPRWTTPTQWLGADDRGSWDAAGGYRELVRRWLRTFGPGTEDDIVWWLGSTKAAVRAALASLEAVTVSLDGGSTGWLLPDDLDEVADPGHWVALLPPLDPTTMGWRARAFALGPHQPQLFDRNGNGGATAWVDGRAVGCWVHDGTGRVVVHLLDGVSPSARRALDAEARRLTEWLDGVQINTGYPSPAMKAARAGG